VVGTALGSLALGALDRLTIAFEGALPAYATTSLVLIAALAFGGLSMRYFADRRKAACYGARKVIVLRRMLGMSFGSLQLVLPNWRIEGADQPFAIRMFPGWSTYVAYPCYAVAGIVSIVSLFLFSALLRLNDPRAIIGLDLHRGALAVGLSAIVFLGLAWTYRKALLDTHERTGLLVAQQLAKWLRLSLIWKVEYVIYRAQLAAYELQRLGLNLKHAKQVLVAIEDREFYCHRGVSLRGFGRIARSALGGPRSGGSTITQQLVRTLFIPDQGKLVRRKLIEVLLARWLDRVFEKERQLEMYLASVRFDRGVMGLAGAMHRFMPDRKTNVSSAVAFFLIERVSNIRSQLLVERIDQTARRLVAQRVLSAKDLPEILALYESAVSRGLISDQANGLVRLRRSWASV
jgi:penicillin-binding protein 1A